MANMLSVLCREGQPAPRQMFRTRVYGGRIVLERLTPPAFSTPSLYDTGTKEDLRLGSLGKAAPKRTGLSASGSERGAKGTARNTQPVAKTLFKEDSSCVRTESVTEWETELPELRLAAKSSPLSKEPLSPAEEALRAVVTAAAALASQHTSKDATVLGKLSRVTSQTLLPPHPAPSTPQPVTQPDAREKPRPSHPGPPVEISSEEALEGFEVVTTSKRTVKIIEETTTVRRAPGARSHQTLEYTKLTTSDVNSSPNLRQEETVKISGKAAPSGFGNSGHRAIQAVSTQSLQKTVPAPEVVEQLKGTVGLKSKTDIAVDQATKGNLAQKSDFSSDEVTAPNLEAQIDNKNSRTEKETKQTTGVQAGKPVIDKVVGNLTAQSVFQETFSDRQPGVVLSSAQEVIETDRLQKEAKTEYAVISQKPTTTISAQVSRNEVNENLASAPNRSENVIFPPTENSSPSPLKIISENVASLSQELTRVAETRKSPQKDARALRELDTNLLSNQPVSSFAASAYQIAQAYKTKQKPSFSENETMAFVQIEEGRECCFKRDSFKDLTSTTASLAVGSEFNEVERFSFNPPKIEVFSAFLTPNVSTAATGRAPDQATTNTPNNTQTVPLNLANQAAVDAEQNSQAPQPQLNWHIPHADQFPHSVPSSAPQPPLPSQPPVSETDRKISFSNAGFFPIQFSAESRVEAAPVAAPVPEGAEDAVTLNRRATAVLANFSALRPSRSITWSRKTTSSFSQKETDSPSVTAQQRKGTVSVQDFRHENGGDSERLGLRPVQETAAVDEHNESDQSASQGPGQFSAEANSSRPAVERVNDTLAHNSDRFASGPVPHIAVQQTVETISYVTHKPVVETISYVKHQPKLETVSYVTNQAQVQTISYVTNQPVVETISFVTHKPVVETISVVTRHASVQMAPQPAGRAAADFLPGQSPQLHQESTALPVAQQQIPAVGADPAARLLFEQLIRQTAYEYTQRIFKRAVEAYFDHYTQKKRQSLAGKTIPAAQTAQKVSESFSAHVEQTSTVSSVESETQSLQVSEETAQKLQTHKVTESNSGHFTQNAVQIGQPEWNVVSLKERTLVGSKERLTHVLYGGAESHLTQESFPRSSRTAEMQKEITARQQAVSAQKASGTAEILRQKSKTTSDFDFHRTPGITPAVVSGQQTESFSTEQVSNGRSATLADAAASSAAKAEGVNFLRETNKAFLHGAQVSHHTDAIQSQQTIAHHLTEVFPHAQETSNATSATRSAQTAEHSRHVTNSTTVVQEFRVQSQTIVSSYQQVVEGSSGVAAVSQDSLHLLAGEHPQPSVFGQVVEDAAVIAAGCSSESVQKTTRLFAVEQIIPASPRQSKEEIVVFRDGANGEWNNIQGFAIPSLVGKNLRAEHDDISVQSKNECSAPRVHPNHEMTPRIPSAQSEKHLAKLLNQTDLPTSSSPLSDPPAPSTNLAARLSALVQKNYQKITQKAIKAAPQRRPSVLSAFLEDDSHELETMAAVARENFSALKSKTLLKAQQGLLFDFVVRPALSHLDLRPLAAANTAALRASCLVAAAQRPRLRAVEALQRRRVPVLVPQCSNEQNMQPFELTPASYLRHLEQECIESYFFAFKRTLDELSLTFSAGLLASSDELYTLEETCELESVFAALGGPRPHSKPTGKDRTRLLKMFHKVRSFAHLRTLTLVRGRESALAPILTDIEFYAVHRMLVYHFYDRVFLLGLGREKAVGYLLESRDRTEAFHLFHVLYLFHHNCVLRELKAQLKITKRLDVVMDARRPGWTAAQAEAVLLSADPLQSLGRVVVLGGQAAELQQLQAAHGERLLLCAQPQHLAELFVEGSLPVGYGGSQPTYLFDLFTFAK